MTVTSEYTHQAGQAKIGCLPLLRSGAASLSLYLRHNSRKAEEWEKRTLTYPDGAEEVTIVPVRTLNAWTGGGSRLQPAPHDGHARRDYREEGAARAKRKVRRVARMYDLRVMWTVTFPGEGVHDYETAYQAISTYLHYHCPVAGWWGLAVAEYHPGGHGFHWHLLCRRAVSRRELAVLQLSWTKYLRDCGLGTGLRDGGLVRHHIKRFGCARHAAAYAAKYVGKTFDQGNVPEGRQRYLRAEGLELPTPTMTTYPSAIDALASLSHPLGWRRFFDGRPKGHPFLWILIESP